MVINYFVVRQTEGTKPEHGIAPPPLILPRTATAHSLAPKIRRGWLSKVRAYPRVTAKKLARSVKREPVNTELLVLATFSPNGLDVRDRDYNPDPSIM